MAKQAIVQAPSQEDALGEFGGSGIFKPLNREPRGAFEGQGGGGKNPECDRAVYGAPSQDAALGAITDGLSGGGKLSSLESGEVGDILDIGKGSEYGCNGDSPFYKGGK